MTTTALKKVTKTESAAIEPTRMTPPKSTLAPVPDMGVYHAYQGRSFGNKSEFDLMDYARSKRLNILIEGPTGDGKTMASMAYAARHNLGFYSVPCNVGVDPAQLFGKWVLGTDGPEWVDGGITHMVRNGGVLLINEINAMPAKVGMVLFSLLDHRREITLLDHKGEVIQAHPDLLIVADMNAGYAGTSPLNAALRNRFPIQLGWDYDPMVEAKLIRSRTLREKIMEGLRASAREGNIMTPTSTNMAIEYERMVIDLGIEFATLNFVNHYREEERSGVALAFQTYMENLVADYQALLDQGPPNPFGDTLVFADTTWIYTARVTS